MNGRMYDPYLGQFLSADPLAEKYVNVSPYSYVLNNPLKAIDLDGKRVIFVNGYNNILFGLLGGQQFSGQKYWNYFSSNGINSSRDFLGANSAEENQFVNASSMIGIDQNGEDRFKLGQRYAMDNYENLSKGMSEGETFKVVSHSEGGAFAAGMADILQKRSGISGSKIGGVSSLLYLSPDESNQFKTPKGIKSFQIHFQNDAISKDNKIDGVNLFFNFKSFNNKNINGFDAHTATPTKNSLDKASKLLKFIPKNLQFGNWNISENDRSYYFEREDEK